MSQRGPARRIAEIAAALILLPLLVASVYLARLDPAVVKARVAQEVRRAIGRDLAIGAMRLTLVPELTIDADDVALANPPGFSRADLLTARHVHARVALLPLLGHHVVIRSIALTAPDLKLEQRADGVANWHFAAPPPPATPAAAQAATPADRRAGTMRLDSLTVLDVSIADGALAWALPRATGAATLPAARLREVNASSTMHLSATAATAAGAVALEGRFGGQAHLWNAADRSPWPVALRLRSDAGAVAVDGTMTAPRDLAGYDVAVRAEGADLGRLGAIWPAWRLPRLRDAQMDTRLIDRLDGLDIPRLALTAGASDLSASVPGLAMQRLAIGAPNIDGGEGTQPNRVSAAGTYAGAPLALEATLGPIGRLFGRGQTAARAPIRLDATANAAGARFAVQGRVAPTGDWAGTDLAVQAAIPDLAPLSALAGRALPPLRDVALAGAVQSARGDLVLRDAHLANPLINVRIDGTARLAGRPRYTGHVVVARLDLDALRAMPAAGAPSASPPPAPAPAPAPAPMPAATIIPDQPIDFSALRSRDIDLTLTVAHLISHGVALDDVAARLLLAAGRLDIEPFSARLGGTPVTGSLSVDAGRDPPALALEAQTAGLNAAQLLTLVGRPAAGGLLDADLSLAGAGHTPHAITGTLQGHVGVALTGGRIDNRLLSAALATLVPATKLGLSLPHAGSSAVACLATRLDLHDGVGVPRAFRLDLDRLTLTASGAIDFGAETFALRLRPVLLLGRTQLVLPSRVDGTWRDPHLSLEPAGGARSAASIAVDLIGGRGHSAAALLAGVAAGDSLLSDGGATGCATAIAVVHDRAAPPTPIGPAAVAAPPPTPRQRAVELLRRLFDRVR